jgi:hypothetical protein
MLKVQIEEPLQPHFNKTMTVLDEIKMSSTRLMSVPINPSA